ncbi:MAG: hypothetical protein CML22_06845 [Rheinheimera sp.]|nr:hypothetical protein [Rheinheimera sp.]MBM34000.1 hypothetical protein [Rheinheimera sp.]|tara:strand:+ start:173 stop:385 length:213 start_codon:yes stop_codon:yes gene_type:complete
MPEKLHHEEVHMTSELEGKLLNCLDEKDRLKESNLQLQHQLKLMQRRISFLTTHSEALSRMINHQYGIRE